MNSQDEELVGGICIWQGDNSVGIIIPPISGTYTNHWSVCLNFMEAYYESDAP